MAEGPWEDFAAPAEEAGPWQDFAPPVPEQPKVPAAFLNRVAAGEAITRIMSKVAEGAKEGWEHGGPPTPTGLSDENLNALMDLGVFHDPLKGRAGPVQMFNEAVVLPLAGAFDVLTRGINAGLYGAAAYYGQIHDELNVGAVTGGTGEQLRREVINAGNWAMIESGFGRFSRAKVAPEAVGRVQDQIIGGLPKPVDFKTAAEVIGPREPLHKTIIEDRGNGGFFVRSAVDPTDMLTMLVDPDAVHVSVSTVGKANRGKGLGVALYEHAIEFAGERGLPLRSDMSVSADAVRVYEALERRGYDVMQAPNSTVSKKGITNATAGYVFEVQPKPAAAAATEANLRTLWEERGIHPAEAVADAKNDAWIKNELVNGEPATPNSLGAAANTDPPLVPLAVQPAPPAGSLVTAAQKAADTLLDIGKDIQMKVAPMATGSTEAIAASKDFANSVRRNRWEWARIDDDLGKRFTPEQRKRMWDAADEESVARQLGESTEHQGLVTLTAEERAAVEAEHARAQVAWVKARDIGLVEGEGLPAYTPRMVLNTANALADDKALPLNSIGANLKTSSPNLRQRKHMTAEETEAAAKAKYGADAEIARDIRSLPLATAKLEDAIAGRKLINEIRDMGRAAGEDMVAEGAIPAGSEHKWFTIDHPAFRTWRPKFDKAADGTVKAVKDAEGNTVFEQVPLYVRDDAEGPLRAVLTTKSGPLYNTLMDLKGKTMSVIMYSPAIHNMVEFGRAFPAMPTRIVKAYFDGNRAKNNVPLMREAIDNGLVPIGKRFFKQDIDDIMEAPDLAPGRSWTAKVLAAVPGLFDEGAGVAVKRAIDKAGDFWHNYLLWDRIADLQMGIYVNLRGDLLAKGVDAQTSSRMAAHFANRYAGALPQEAMSAAARKTANMLLFSRTFTMGNLGVMKDILTGMPKDVLAQIERDMGVVDPAAKGYAKSLARRKAFAVVALDVGLMYAGNAFLQSVLNMMLGDRTLEEEFHGYARRLKEVMSEVGTHPLSLLQPFELAERLSPTSENEPGRKDRIKIGYTKEGTAIYARNPVGKIGEEFIGFMTSPLDMLRRKEGTVARPMLQVFANDKGFGRKIYDPDASTPAERAGVIWAIVEHIAKAQTPEAQIGAFADLVRGEGDAKLNTLQTLGPFGGVTFSKGAPGGPAMGEIYSARSKHDFQVNLALPDIRRQIVRGDIAGAQERMQELGIPPGLQRFYIRTSLNPATRLTGRALRDFYQYSTPEQRDRMERVRAGQ